MKSVLGLRHHVTAVVFAGAVVASSVVGTHDPANAEVSSETSQSVLPVPVGSVRFGSSVVVLANGNYAVLDTEWNSATTAAVGAVYLYDGRTDEVISTLIGRAENDLSSARITEVGNSNVVLTASRWDGDGGEDAGAITWIDGVVGLSGGVGESNSRLGSSAGDRVGSNGVTVLTDGDFVVSSQLWANVGAVTWFDGNVPTAGSVSPANSLVGAQSGDEIGDRVIALSNGNYLTSSEYWSNGAQISAGAATWGSGDGGTVGVVSAANSLVGTQSGDSVGNQLLVLADGDFVVGSSAWSNGAETSAGAATWGSGDGGTVGAVSAMNSLVGTQTGDRVANSLLALKNGDYAVGSQGWANGGLEGAGAATWGDGGGATVGEVSSSNSLVGAHEDDGVGTSLVALTNGNYVVSSPGWSNNGSDDAGAVTWGNSDGGTVGEVGATNSLIGVRSDVRVGSGGVTPLTNGNYVVASPSWFAFQTNGRGAVTWGDGASGTVGAVSFSNSLVGGSLDDRVGLGGAVALTNGNYVVTSQFWDSSAAVDVGAVTWGDGTVPIVGQVGPANSLVGATASDRVGHRGVAPLTNGNYVVVSSRWNSSTATTVGAVTWGDGSSGSVGDVGPANSLVGTRDNDQVGRDRVRALSDGNYVVVSSRWDSITASNVGAATWRDGTMPSTAVVGQANSLIGTSENDKVGSDGHGSSSSHAKFVVELELGDDFGGYVVVSSRWATSTNPSAGAVTFGAPGIGAVGEVGVLNSAIGSGQVRRPSSRLTSGDAVVIPTGSNRVLLLHLDRPPVLAAEPANLAVEPTPGSDSAQVVFASPIADDVRDGPILSSCTPASGSAFPIGATTVTCTATDSKGQSSSTRFTVTVSEPEPGPEVSSEVVSLTPGRVFSSRSSDETVDGLFQGEGRVPAGSFVEVDITGRAGVASDAKAVVMNVTAINSSGRGFATAYPCGDRPLASSLNYGSAGAVVGNELIAKLSSTGQVCAYTSAATDLTIDVVGYVPASSDVVSTDPARVYATRVSDETVDGLQEAQGRVAAGAFVEVEIVGRAGVPASGVGAVVMNVTAINPSGRGFITAYTCGTRPLASSLNFGAAGAVVGNELIAKLSGDGTVCVYSSASTDLTVDVVGYVPSSSAATSLDPARVYATRVSDVTVDGLQEAQGRVAAGAFVEVEVAGRAMVPASGAGAVVMNITAINPSGRGFITTYPCGERPLASSLNYSAAGAVVGNELVAKLSSAGTVCVYSSAATDLTVDVVGYVPG